MSNETKFTPGPWTANESESVLGGNMLYISQEEGAPYTEYYSDVCQTHEGEDLDVQKANARLIAAAPDMYALLDEFSTLVMPTAGELYKMCDKATALLAKARGDSNEQ